MLLIEIMLSLQTQLEIEPRFPIFGGWQTSFTVGYGLPLQDFLFKLDGKYMLNITFGSPMDEVVIDNLIIKVNYFSIICSHVALDFLTYCRLLDVLSLFLEC